MSVPRGGPVPGLGLQALARVPAEDHDSAAGLFFAWSDAGVGVGGRAVGAVASLTGPAGSPQVAAGAVAAAILARGHQRQRSR